MHPKGIQTFLNLIARFSPFQSESCFRFSLSLLFKVLFNCATRCWAGGERLPTHLGSHFLPRSHSLSIENASIMRGAFSPTLFMSNGERKGLFDSHCPWQYFCQVEKSGIMKRSLGLTKVWRRGEERERRRPTKLALWKVWSEMSSW